MNRWQGVGDRAQNRGAEPPTDPVTMESSKMKMGAETVGQTRRGRRPNGRSTPPKRPPVHLDDLDPSQEPYLPAYKRAGAKALRSARRGSGGGKGRGGGGGCRVRITF